MESPFNYLNYTAVDPHPSHAFVTQGWRQREKMRKQKRFRDGGKEKNRKWKMEQGMKEERENEFKKKSRAINELIYFALISQPLSGFTCCCVRGIRLLTSSSLLSYMQ